MKPRTTLALILGIVALLLAGVAVRAGIVAALVVAAVAFAMLAIPAVVLLVAERRKALVAERGKALGAAAPASRPVKHCDCCDRACLMAKVCAPGPEPTVVHGAAVS